ncbi:valacyclovir hydrolase [Colletotrichum karsti]|uniref:Valacyclovir hydrolase n=1 Tax=Colletotrichum karsti TaxID=1095194 RepID=A0A9P6HV38_9PEZI|nr:valacyclovir hydrolase [Colletotrichum karsti]KAF9871338.1 valacyclovir hydrolase [Colletotrichum karsti]
MSDASKDLVLPRPGGAYGSQAPIPGASEEAFTAAFGALLPPAQYLTTPTGKAAYFEIPPSSPGDGANAPDRVLFIHGVQTPALGMLPLAKALHASFPQTHFALVDLWGHGLTDTPVVPHEPRIFHELLDALLDQLGWPCAHLVGYSFGAALTVGYVASRASRVKSFVLVAPAGLLRASEFTAEQQNYLRGNDVDETAARKFTLNFLEGGDLVVPTDWKERVAKGEVVAEAVREWQMREHPGHTASVVAIFRDGGVFDNDAEFVRAVGTGIPSLVVLGELDDLCSEGQIKELGLRNVVVVPKVGHAVVRQRVPEVAASISGFWKKEA